MVGTGPFVPQPARRPSTGVATLWSYPRRRTSRLLPLYAARPNNRRSPPLSPGADRRRGTPSRERLPRPIRCFYNRVRVFRGYSQPQSDNCDSNSDPAKRQQIAQLISWPTLASVSWRKGFLPASSTPREVAMPLRCVSPLRRADHRLTADSLKRFGFDVAYDRTRDTNGLTSVRIRGGLSEHLRFFHLTDPAITRKRSIEGQMVKTFAKLRIVSVESLGLRMPMYDITTGTGDFIANGVVSHNCFARPTHKYLDFDAGRDFEREIVVKVNAPEVLRVELARPSWKGEHVALGTNTDPYQWVEGRYRLMQGIWEAMRDFANPCSVLTKSPLLLRDLPLMLEIAAADEHQRVPVDPDARREGLAGNRAAHAEPAGAVGGGRGAQPRGNPHGRADRAADARHQRRPASGRAPAGGGEPRRARRASAAWRCTCAARCGTSSWTGCALSAPTSSSATRSSTAAAPTRRRRSGSASHGWCAAASTAGGRFATTRAQGRWWTPEPGSSTGGEPSSRPSF